MQRDESAKNPNIGLVDCCELAGRFISDPMSERPFGKNVVVSEESCADLKE